MGGDTHPHGAYLVAVGTQATPASKHQGTVVVANTVTVRAPKVVQPNGGVLLVASLQTQKQWSREQVQETRRKGCLVKAARVHQGEHNGSRDSDPKQPEGGKEGGGGKKKVREERRSLTMPPA